MVMDTSTVLSLPPPICPCLGSWLGSWLGLRTHTLSLLHVELGAGVGAGREGGLLLAVPYPAPSNNFLRLWSPHILFPLA